MRNFGADFQNPHRADQFVAHDFDPAAIPSGYAKVGARILSHTVTVLDFGTPCITPQSTAFHLKHSPPFRAGVGPAAVTVTGPG